MGKLEPFDMKMTKWMGLWWHPEINAFTSGVLSLSDLRKFKGNVRLQVRKNKFFNNGEGNRPNYCFTIRDAKSEVFHDVEIVDDEEQPDYPTDKDGNRLYTEDEVWRVIHGMEVEHGLSYGDNLISDYLY